MCDIPVDQRETVLIQQGVRIAKQMQADVNALIAPMTDGFLKMAFEEMLLPSMFMGKKKYCGVIYAPDDEYSALRIHVTTKDLLLKGIDFIKSQYPPLIKQHGYGIINEIMTAFATRLRAHM